MGPPLRRLVAVLEDEVPLVLQRYLPDDVPEVTVERAVPATAALRISVRACAGEGGAGCSSFLRKILEVFVAMLMFVVLDCTYWLVVRLVCGRNFSHLYQIVYCFFFNTRMQVST